MKGESNSMISFLHSIIKKTSSKIQKYNFVQYGGHDVTVRLRRRQADRMDTRFCKWLMGFLVNNIKR